MCGTGELIIRMKLIRKLHRTYKILQNKVQSHDITHRSEDEKREYMSYWAKRAGFKTFVETGTYLGKTAKHISAFVDRCHTIELSQGLYEAAKEALAPYENITLYQGDTAIILPAILEKLDEPALFWLDAHYSAGPTAGAEARAPIETELGTIFRHPVKDHVVLIDDAREFIGMNGYPTIKRLKKLVRKTSGGYKMIINNDIIIIYREDI